MCDYDVIKTAINEKQKLLQFEVLKPTSRDLPGSRILVKIIVQEEIETVFHL